MSAAAADDVLVEQMNLGAALLKKLRSEPPTPKLARAVELLEGCSG